MPRQASIASVLHLNLATFGQKLRKPLLMQIPPTFRKVITASLACALVSFAGAACAAEARAIFTDTCSNGREGPNPFDCGRDDSNVIMQRVVVTITPDSQDIGRIGGFYVGIRTDGQARGNFTANGWAGLAGGLFEPAALFESLPSGAQKYGVLEGAMLCQQIGGGTSELWAGYGIIDDNAEVIIKNYQQYLSKGITYEHLVRTYVQHDMAKNERAWKVLEVTCPVESNDHGN